MNDTELFDLCKEVYERTGWITGATGKCFKQADGNTAGYVAFGFVEGSTPLYTSDYLLEKLPPAIWEEVSGEGKLVHLLTINMQGNGEATAVYILPYDEESRGAHQQRADTPLKALLKLTITLHKAGELREESN